MTGRLLAALVMASIDGCQPAPAAMSLCPDWSGTMDFSGSERVPQPPFEATGERYHLALAFGADDFCAKEPRPQADFFILEAAGLGPRYTRYGEFRLDEADEIVHVTGAAMIPRIQVPKDALDVVIGLDGLVSIRRPDSSRLEEIGIIQVARFAKASALRALGAGLFEAPPEAGAPLIGRPTIMGYGRVYQGKLDRSEASRTTPPTL